MKLQAEENNHDAKALAALKEKEQRLKEKKRRKKKKNASKREKRTRMMLSFDADELDEVTLEGEKADDASKHAPSEMLSAVIRKNPEVPTDFLPDRCVCSFEKLFKKHGLSQFIKHTLSKLHATNNCNTNKLF